MVLAWSRILDIEQERRLIYFNDLLLETNSLLVFRLILDLRNLCAHCDLVRRDDLFPLKATVCRLALWSLSTMHILCFVSDGGELWLF